MQIKKRIAISNEHGN